MANTKISALTNGDPLQTTDQIPVARGAGNVKITGDGVSTLVVGNTHTKFTGPTSSDKTFTLPDASSTILTSNAAVTVAQGGTGRATLTTHGVLIGEGTAAINQTAAGTAGQALLSGGAGADPAFGALDISTSAITGTLPPANGGVAKVSTAALGYFWGGTVFDIRNAGANNALVNSANQVRAFQFVLPYTVTVGRVTWGVAANAGDTVSFGIYSADGATKLVDSGATVSAGTNAVQSVTIGAVTLPPGIYYFAWTQSNTTTTFNTFAQFNTMTALINNNSQKRMLTAGNAATAGAFPSSLGTLTTAVSAVMPMVIFES